MPCACCVRRALGTRVRRTPRGGRGQPGACIRPILGPPWALVEACATNRPGNLGPLRRAERYAGKMQPCQFRRCGRRLRLDQHTKAIADARLKTSANQKVREEVRQSRIAAPRPAARSSKPLRPSCSGADRERPKGVFHWHRRRARLTGLLLVGALVRIALPQAIELTAPATFGGKRPTPAT